MDRYVRKQVQKNGNSRIYIAGVMFTVKFFKLCGTWDIFHNKTLNKSAAGLGSQTRTA